MAEAGLFAVAILLFRMVVAMGVVILRIIGILFLLPIWRPRRSPGYARTRRYTTKVKSPPPTTFLHDVAVLVHVLKSPAGTPMYGAPTGRPGRGGGNTPVAPRQEPSRNQVDVAITLRSLGTPPREAEELAQRVVDELGRDAPLNDLVKRALQLKGTAK